MRGRLGSYLKTCERTNVCLHLLYGWGQECRELKKFRHVWRQSKSSISEVNTVASKDNGYLFCGHLLQTNTSQQKHELVTQKRGLLSKRLKWGNVGEHLCTVAWRRECNVTYSLCMSRKGMKSNTANQLWCSVHLKQAWYSSYSCSGSAMFRKRLQAGFFQRSSSHQTESELFWPLENT